MIARRALALAVLLASMMVATVAAARDRVIAAGHEKDFVQLVAPYRLTGPIVADRVLANIELHPGFAELEITRADVHGARLVVLRMSVDDLAPGGFRYSTTPAANNLDPVTRDAATRLEGAIRSNLARNAAPRVLADPGSLSASKWHTDRDRVVYLLLSGALAVALLLAFATRARPDAERAPTAALALAVGASLLAIAALGWFVSARGQLFSRWLPHAGLAVARQKLAAELALTVAVGALAVAAAKAVKRIAWNRAVLEALAVLAFSVFVRASMTHANILTDGGSGYRRLMQFIGGFGGLSVLVGVFAPDGPMWTAIRVPIVLSALAPALLTVFARVVGFRRPIPLLAGLMLASLPLHAAMFTSDFEMGPLLTLTLVGLALAAAGSKSGDDLPVFAGTCVLAYGVWCRPDAAVAGAPLLAVSWAVVRSFRKHPLAVFGFGLFGANMIAAQVAMHDGARAPRLPFAHAWQFLLIPAVVPYWLTLGVALGIAYLRATGARLSTVIAVGVLSGLLPLSMRVGPDPTHSYMETFRYGAWTLPWLLLLAGAGWVEATTALAARAERRATPARARRIRRAVLALVGAFVVSSPVRARSYLAREYGPRSEERVFRQALAKVPRGCTLVVPDDIADVARHGAGTVEIETRYDAIASEQAELENKGAVDTLGVTAFLDALATHGWPRDPGSGAPHCYFFFEGSYCYTGIDGVPSAACRKLLSDVHARPVFVREIEYVSHRFVTRPDLRAPPLYDPHQELRLYALSAPPDAGRR